jgi:hypothetical protein
MRQVLTLIVLLTVFHCIFGKTVNVPQKGLEQMERHTLLSYASYCGEASLRKWDCYWCNKTTPITVTEYVEKATDYSISGFIGHDRENVYVVFRGTKGTKLDSWLTNLHASRELDWPPTVNGSHVHRGFYLAYIDHLANKTLEAVRKLAHLGKRIKVMGHSRGAALGLLAATHLSVNGFLGKVDWMGFGTPRVGNTVFAEWFRRIVPNAIRVVHKRDPVTRLPPMALLGFRHVTQEVWFDEDRKPKICSNHIGDDPDCSVTVWFPWLFDHFGYLGHDKRSGKAHGCD